MRMISFQVPPGAEGKKAADLLRFCCPELRESEIREAFRRKDVKLDGKPAARDAVAVSGQMLKVFLPGENSARFAASSGEIPLDIVYEDADVLLVNKPAGIPVSAEDHADGMTLTALCRIHAPEAEPVHRLDVKTSGLCLFALNSAVANVLKDIFRNRQAEKVYECLVRGEMKPPAAVCRAWLMKDAEKARVRILDHPASGAREIVTGYETLESGPVSRLRVRLYTGRTHQIRAHLAALGHPLLGDDVYGDRALNRRLHARALKLCAVSLTLHTDGRLPALDGKSFTIRAPF